MRASVHPSLRRRPERAWPAALLISLLTASAAAAGYPPPGMVVWDSRTYTLQTGESMQFQIEFDQIPVRRWMLLVEGDVRRSYLNLRRLADGSLVYDQRGETRHLAEIPWGQGEVLSGVLTAVRQGGAFTISFWGPPPDDYLKAYRYEVNRALEALAAGQRGRAVTHLQAALQRDPTDAVARVLLLGVADGVSVDTGPADGLPGADPALLNRADAEYFAALESHVDSLRAADLAYTAIDTLQTRLAEPASPALQALIYAELADLFLHLGNPQQAAVAVEKAAALWLQVPPGEETGGGSVKDGR